MRLRHVTAAVASLETSLRTARHKVRELTVDADQAREEARTLRQLVARVREVSESYDEPGCDEIFDLVREVAP